MTPRRVNAVGVNAAGMKAVGWTTSLLSLAGFAVLGWALYDSARAADHPVLAAVALAVLVAGCGWVALLAVLAGYADQGARIAAHALLWMSLASLVVGIGADLLLPGTSAAPVVVRAVGGCVALLVAVAVRTVGRRRARAVPPPAGD